MSRPRRDLAPLVALAAVALLAGLAHGRLQPENGPWSARFDPPYDNRTLRFQLRVFEWWAGGADTATIPKGTKFPILDDYCGNEPKVCPSWTLPGDLTLQFGPPTVQDAHRLNIFLSDSGNRVPVYAAPTEHRSVGPCTGAPGSVCCGDAEYTLERPEIQHAVFKMWVSRPNGTVLNDGSQPTNFRAAKARLTVRTGFYTGTVTWPNFFHQLAGESGDDKIQASITLAADSPAASYLDVASTLVNGYTLLVPFNDPVAPGFVVPNAQLGEQLAPLDIESWRACRAAKCGAPLGACVSQGPTPYAAHRGKTTASFIAESWNALGRDTKKQCWVLGNSQWTLQNPDLTQGDTVPTQLVGCDYQSTYLAPIIKIPRALIEAGNTAPPPPSPPPAPPSPRPTPSGTVSPAVTSSPTLSPAPSPSPPPFRSMAPPPPSPVLPPPSAPKTQGPALSLVFVLPAYTPAEFNATGKDVLNRALIKGAQGTTVKPTFRYRSITTAAATAALKSFRRLMAASPATSVDLVMYFAPSDATPSLALLTALETDPSSVLPKSEFGDVKLAQAVSLNCITPCGDQGKAGPRVAPGGTVSCTCECDEGWHTAVNQSFDSFKYCNVATGTNSATPGSPAAPDGSTGGSDSTAPHALASWRPPVARPPPLPPKDYKEDGGGMSSGEIASIVAALLFAVLVGYFAWRTGCGCCKNMYAACAAMTWTRCCAGKKVAQDESEEGDETDEGAIKAKKIKKKKETTAPKAVKAQRQVPEGEEEEEEEADVEAAEGSNDDRNDAAATSSPKKYGGRRKKGAGNGRGTRR